MQITKEQLKAALAQWEQLHRDGGCRTEAEAMATSVEVVASTNADYLWNVLTSITAAEKGE